jgi:hypothetical protein
MISTKIPFEQAKATYVHRFTIEHVPSWALKPMDNGKFYAPQYSSDKEWYDNTEFPPQNGLRKYCTSINQSWPLGQLLDAPFKPQ